jgi:hypothetical protein
MKYSFVLPLVVGLASAQPPPPPVLLTASKSGVLPVVPTNFPGAETDEGAIIYQGPVNPGFEGEHHLRD